MDPPGLQLTTQVAEASGLSGSSPVTRMAPLGESGGHKRATPSSHAAQGEEEFWRPDRPDWAVTWPALSVCMSPGKSREHPELNLVDNMEITTSCYKDTKIKTIDPVCEVFSTVPKAGKYTVGKKKKKKKTGEGCFHSFPINPLVISPLTLLLTPIPPPP